MNEGGKPELSPGPWRSARTPHCYLCCAIARLTHLAPMALNTSNALTLLYGRNFDLLSCISERAVLVRAGDKLRASLASRSFFFPYWETCPSQEGEKGFKRSGLEKIHHFLSPLTFLFAYTVVERTIPLHSGCAPSLASRRDVEADIMPLPRFH